MKTNRILLSIVFAVFFVSCSKGEYRLLDVHGAGAQRSDPKAGDPDQIPIGKGPQGDVRRIYNYARCVRRGTTAGKNLQYPIVDTAQTRCYGNKGTINCPQTGKKFNGQDAQYHGVSPSYTDNGNSTITDNVTGLMWQKTFKQLSWAEAELDASKERTAGYSDWRVPTIKELYSLINFDGSTGTSRPDSPTAPGNAIPYIDTNYFDFEYPTNTRRYIDAQYITNTSYVSGVMGEQNGNCFFGVNLADGRIKCYPKASRGRKNWYVRYVRGPVNYGSNSFSDNGDQTITDKATGLSWTQIDSGDKIFKNNLGVYKYKNGSLDWNEALNFCESLSFAGKRDWRLPNAKELHSIVDYSRSPDTTNSAAIDPIFNTTSIIDEGGNQNYPFFWTSTTLLDGMIQGADGVIISFGGALGHMSPGGHRRK